MKKVLDKNGRFVVEFGGKGNVQRIVEAISNVLFKDYGIEASELNPWYFPSIGEYSSLLEQQGFRVTYAVHFDRPTKLEDGENGLNIWLEGLAADDFFNRISQNSPTSNDNAIHPPLNDNALQPLSLSGG